MAYNVKTDKSLYKLDRYLQISTIDISSEFYIRSAICWVSLYQV